MGWKEFFKQLLIVFVVLLPNIGGIIIGAFTTGDNIRDWYDKLVLPPLRPPNWVKKYFFTA